MAVAYDTAVDAYEGGGDGVLSLSITATGSDRAAFIGSANVHSSSPSIGGSVSYGGSAATELWDYECDSGGDDNRNRTAGYSFVAPGTTSTTVTNTLTSAPAYGHMLGVITMTGVDQVTPCGTAVTGQGDGTTPSVTVADVVSGEMVVDCTSTLYSGAGLTETPGANQTQRCQERPDAVSCWGMSTQAGADGGVMSWTLSGSGARWGLGAVAFKQNTGAPVHLTNELTHYVKKDPAQRTTTSTTAVELTDYTIAWSALTGAGFAAGDSVALVVGCKVGASAATANARFRVGFGSTWAGRSDDGTSLIRWESSSTTSPKGTQYLWLAQRTLVDGENIYFSGDTTTGTGHFDDFFCLILGAAKLGANLLYAEATHSSDAPSSYDTSGASITTGHKGDWLFLACSRWLDDSTSADYLMAIAVDGADYAEVQKEGEDTGDEPVLGTLMYSAGLDAGKVARVRYRVDTGGTHDCVRTAILGLRLDAFKDHVGTRTTNTVTHSAADTYQEVWGPSYTATYTGNVVALCQPIHTLAAAAQLPYGRIQLAGADWDAADANRCPVQDNGTAMQVAPLLFGYGSVAAGSLDFDFDCASDAAPGTNFSCDEQIGAIFSLQLAESLVFHHVGPHPTLMRM